LKYFNNFSKKKNDSEIKKLTLKKNILASIIDNDNDSHLSFNKTFLMLEIEIEK
jgi:hypothetical protein